MKKLTDPQKTIFIIASFINFAYIEYWVENLPEYNQFEE